MSDKALSAARVRMQPYLDQGRRQRGIEVLRQVAQRKALEEAVEQARKQRAPLRAGTRGAAAIERTERILDRLLSGKGEASQAEAEALVDKGLGLLEKFRLLAERCGIPWKSPTSEGPPAQGGEQATPATEQPAHDEQISVTQPATAQAAKVATPAAPAEAAATVAKPDAEPAPGATTAAETPGAEPPGAETAAAKIATATGAGVAGAGPSLQFPMEVQAFRPLFRFFHEGLTPGRQDWVQHALASVVQGSPPSHRISELHRELRPFLPDGHPMKKYMTRLAAGLRAEGLDGRRFALYCLLALQLPGWQQRLMDLSKAELPSGLDELVRYYRDLLLGLS